MKNSKIVYIRRKKLSNQLPGAKDQDSIMKIGSSLNGQKPLSPFNESEERYYLSKLIDVQPTDNNWRKAVTDYWSNISRPVPNTVSGLRLEIGILTDENGEPKYESVDGNKFEQPLNLPDYILYKYCLVYGRVANTEKDCNKSPKIRFYLYSEFEELESELKESNLKRKAYQEFLKVVSDKNRVDDILRLLGERPDLMNSTVRELTLEKFALGSKRPDGTGGVQNMSRFLNVVNDKDLELKGFIEAAVIAQKLRRLPNTQTIVMGDDNTTIGDTLTDAVAYLKNPKNSNVLTTLKAQMNYMTGKKETIEDKKSDEVVADTKGTKESSKTK